METFEVTTALAKAVADGTERIPIDDGGTPGVLTVSVLFAWVVEQVEPYQTAAEAARDGAQLAQGAAEAAQAAAELAADRVPAPDEATALHFIRQNAAGDDYELLTPTETLNAVGGLPTAALTLNYRTDLFELRYSSATELVAARGNRGDRLALPDGAGGFTYHVVAADLVADNTGLDADTLYYVYVYDDGGTLRVEISTTVPTSDHGLPVKTGALDRLHFGWVYTNGSTPGEFVSSATQRRVRSVFNEVPIKFEHNGLSGSIAGSGLAQWVSGPTVQLLCVEGDLVQGSGGYTALGGAGIEHNMTAIYMDGSSLNIESVNTGTSSAYGDPQVPLVHKETGPNLRTFRIGYGMNTSNGNTAAITRGFITGSITR